MHFYKAASFPIPGISIAFPHTSSRFKHQFPRQRNPRQRNPRQRNPRQQNPMDMSPTEKATQLVWANILRFTNATEVNDFTMKTGCCSAPFDLLWDLLFWFTTDKPSAKLGSTLRNILLCSYGCLLSNRSLKTITPKCLLFGALLVLLILEVAMRIGLFGTVAAERHLMGTLWHILRQCRLRLYRAFTAWGAAPNTPQDDQQPHPHDHQFQERDRVQQNPNMNERPRIRRVTIRRRRSSEYNLFYE